MNSKAVLKSHQPHTEGLTSLAFSTDGLHAFTAGEDNIVRIWTLSENTDVEPPMATDADDPITALCVYDDGWFSGTTAGTVRHYDKDSAKMNGHFTDVGPANAVRCIAIDPRRKTVAVGSDGLNLRLVELDDPKKTQELNRNAIRKVTWHPTEPILVTCGLNGDVVVWDVTTANPLKIFSNFIPTVINLPKRLAEKSPNSSFDFLYDCSAVWHPSGKQFYLASRARDIACISQSTWTRDSTIVDRDAPGHVTALAVSPNGAFIASASFSDSSSTVYIWDRVTRKIITQHTGTSKTVVTQLAFSPVANVLAWTDSGGEFHRWIDPIQADLVVPISNPIEGLGTMFDDDDAEADIVIGGDNDEPMDDVEDNVSEPEQDWLDDDNDATAAGFTRSDFVKEMVSITQAQPPFQPGATPMQETKQLLSTNRLGYIEVTAPPDSEHHLVDVRFFDLSRAKVSFKDEFKFHLGVLGERGALFACRPQDSRPALVQYRPYVKDSTTQWTYTLPRDCTVLGIAAGGLPLTSSAKDVADLDGFGNIVIATTQGDLTFMSGTGRERRIIALGGDFVSMVAGHEWVFVVHRAGSTTIDGSQNLSYTLINLDDFSVRQRDFLPIPKGHTLKWIGITEEGAPAMYDSTGRLHVLTKYRTPHHASWARILDTNLLERKIGKDESYWPFAISGSQCLCFILKGMRTYPTFPIPPHYELPIEMPFRTDNKPEEKIERDVLMLEILRDGLDDQLTNEEISRTEQRVDKDLVLLVQSAIQKSNIARAVELAKLIHNSRALDSVIKMAEFYHLAGLKEKLQTLKDIREQSEDRLVVARDKRKEWMRPDPLPRSLGAMDFKASGVRPFQDFGPPPTVSRPGLAPAVPVKETTRFTASTTVDIRPTPVESVAGSPPENKRKRDEVEEVSSSFDFAAPPLKQKINPFARKVGQENNRSNLFARKSDSTALQKSESFFDKVDAAEDSVPKTKRLGASKSKEKEKKDGPRQMTLFGMMSSAPRSDKRVPAVQPTPDITMADASQVETQPDLPEEWEETQPVDGTSLLDETQPVAE
ncbi:chromosome segregation protein [Favolaschia claudopus]|uniref:Chromosome segregation protein n=1 Tax=Favolaschia claudopus TaxID=2862362 RepID=A0AAW0E008_9AGAR